MESEIIEHPFMFNRLAILLVSLILHVVHKQYLILYPNDDASNPDGAGETNVGGIEENKQGWTYLVKDDTASRPTDQPFNFNIIYITHYFPCAPLT